MDIHIHVGGDHMHDLVKQLSDVAEPSKAQGHLPLEKGPMRTGSKDPREGRIKALAEALKMYLSKLEMTSEAAERVKDIPDNSAGTYSTPDYIKDLNDA